MPIDFKSWKIIYKMGKIRNLIGEIVAKKKKKKS